MRSALLVGFVALGSLAGPSLTRAQHAAPSAGRAAAPVVHVAPANAVSHPVANHHASNATPPVVTHASNSKPYPLDVYGAGVSATAPRFIPASPGGFANPLDGANNARKRSKPPAPTQIIIFGGAYGYGYPYAADDSQLQAQDQAPDQSDDQQSGGQQQSQYVYAQQTSDPRDPAQQRSGDQTVLPEEAPAVPLRDVGSFTLVTREGYRLDAVAFTRLNDRLVYITPDGGRRTIAFRDLDIDSTQRVNQELGTPIDLPSDDAPPAKQDSKPSAEITN
jgi:hypothetical protein